MNRGLELFNSRMTNEIVIEYNKEVEIPEYKNIDQYRESEFPNTARTQDMVGVIMDRYKQIWSLASCICRTREKGDDTEREQAVLMVGLSKEDLELAEVLSWWKA